MIDPSLLFVDRDEVRWFLSSKFQAIMFYLIILYAVCRHRRSLKGIGKSSSNGEVLLLENMILGGTLESHFASMDFFICTPE